MSVVESCRSALPASSSTAKSANRDPLFSFNRSPVPVRDSGPCAAPGSGRTTTSPCCSGSPSSLPSSPPPPPSRPPPGPLQAPADLVEHPLRDPQSAHPRGDRHREDPPARRRAELPGADLPGDETDDLAPGFRCKEDPVLLLAAPVMREDPTPIRRLLVLGTDVIDFDDRVEVGGHGVADLDWIFHCHMVP